MIVSEKVKHIMEIFHLSLDNVSEYLGVTSQSLRNKLNRDSFSVRDLIILSHLCNAELNIKFLAQDEMEPITFEFNSLPQEDLDRLQQLELEKIQNTFEDLKNTISKLPLSEQKNAIQYLQSLQNTQK